MTLNHQKILLYPYSTKKKVITHFFVISLIILQLQTIFMISLSTFIKYNKYFLRRRNLQKTKVLHLIRYVYLLLSYFWCNPSTSLLVSFSLLPTQHGTPCRSNFEPAICLICLMYFTRLASPLQFFARNAGVNQQMDTRADKLIRSDKAY